MILYDKMGSSPSFIAGPPGTMHVLKVDSESGEASVERSNDEATRIVSLAAPVGSRVTPAEISAALDDGVSPIRSKSEAAQIFGEGSMAAIAAGHFLHGEWPSHVRAREAQAVLLVERVEVVRGIFDAARWEGRKSVRRLAKRWGISREAVREVVARIEDRLRAERQPATFFPATTLGEVATTVAANGSEKRSDQI